MSASPAAERPERILMVTPYPPIRDGIGAYAVQQVQRLRAAGHDVEVLSPQPSAAHHHLDLRSPRGPLALAKRVRGYDRVIVQYHPDLFSPPTAGSRARARAAAGLLVAFRSARRVEVVLHEVDYDGARRLRPDALVARLLWRSVDQLGVHTEAERQRLVAAFGLAPDRVTLLDHGEDFVRRTDLDRAGARARLGVDPDAHVFLAIGFIQPHKGFDRAVRAFARLPEGSAELHVVGSVRVEDPAYLAYVEGLRASVAATPGAFLREGWVSDEAFDVWLVAADTVVLPYRHIWSSSVIERAALYDRPIIASRVGGLASQAPPGTVLVDDDDELATAMAERVAVAVSAARPGAPSGEVVPSGAWDVDPTHPDREQVLAQVRARADAARGRPLGPRPAVGQAIGTRAVAAGRRPAAPTGLDRLEPFALPPVRSRRPGVGLVKRVVRSLTAWQVDPIVDRLNELQRTTADALAERDHPTE